MRKIEKPVEIEQGDSFKVILSKYGALGLDKQENLSELIGDLEGQLDIEKGVLTFSDDISFNVQILGFFNEEAKKWSWAWDNESIGFDESLIEAAKEIHEIGLKYEIGQFTTFWFVEEQTSEIVICHQLDHNHCGCIRFDTVCLAPIVWDSTSHGNRQS